ncbi:MAG: protein arginine kinase [Planctomycetia bacterium]|nr:protein arginine kinase [Planctomycetia bacterium]
MDHLDIMLQNTSAWLKNVDEQAGIVISSRIRLARNLADFPFSVRMSDSDRSTTVTRLNQIIKDCPACQHFHSFSMEELDEPDRLFLMERHLISRELAEGKGARGVLISPDEEFSIMINEEDHLRIQVVKSGFNLEAAWEDADALDDQIESRAVYAWHPELGYLTACPTNVGTGMRVSLMMHLPALKMTRQFVRMHQSLQKISLTVRGLYGEGSQALGDFYQISNQTTLGMTEQDLLKQVIDVTNSVIGYETHARKHLLDTNKTQLLAEIDDSISFLRTAEVITLEETLRSLSLIRMGIQMNLIHNIPLSLVNTLSINAQPAHLERIFSGIFSSGDINIFRAQYLQKQMLQI